MVYILYVPANFTTHSDLEAIDSAASAAVDKQRNTNSLPTPMDHQRGSEQPSWAEQHATAVAAGHVLPAIGLFSTRVPQSASSRFRKGTKSFHSNGPSVKSTPESRNVSTRPPAIQSLPPVYDPVEGVWTTCAPPEHHLIGMHAARQVYQQQQFVSHNESQEVNGPMHTQVSVAWSSVTSNQVNGDKTPSFSGLPITTRASYGPVLTSLSQLPAATHASYGPLPAPTPTTAPKVKKPRAPRRSKEQMATDKRLYEVAKAERKFDRVEKRLANLKMDQVVRASLLAEHKTLLEFIDSEKKALEHKSV